MVQGSKPAASEAKPSWRRVSDPAAIAEALLAGERAALARAITLVESTRAEDRTIAEALLAQVLPRTGAAVRVGITGTPGVGKSTFIEAFGRYLTAAGHRVAVLAVDPSSARSGGSILGDKTRMTELARDPAAFIRPSPASGTLGGVARRTREALLLAEAAGFDVVLVETVGVGQSETAVADMVDMFLLLLAPGGGDELQGIKRGIMELADLVVVNKADSDLLQPARLAAAEYKAALHLMRPKSPAWSAKVLLASAMERIGMAEVWDAVVSHRHALEAAGELGQRRAEQAKAWLWSELAEGLTERFRLHPAVAAELPALEAAVAAGRVAPSAAARALLGRFLGAMPH
jgi:LAO/AO transport system kinase